MQEALQRGDRRVCAYTDVRDEFHGQFVCQAGDRGPSFLQKIPAREDMHTSARAWLGKAGRLLLRGRVQTGPGTAQRTGWLVVGTQPCSELGCIEL